MNHSFKNKEQTNVSHTIGNITEESKLGTSFKPPPFAFGSVQKKSKKDREEQVQMKKAGRDEEEQIQMKKAEEEEHVQMKKGEIAIHEKSTGSSNSKMPKAVQSKMENSFGQDFSNVNIHTNSNSAKGMNALAYTQGNDIHFATGQYDPTSNQGQKLLGHELTHVVQQSQGRVSPTHRENNMNVNASKPLEGEADKMGNMAARGEKVNVGAIQKKEGVGRTVQMSRISDGMRTAFLSGGKGAMFEYIRNLGICVADSEAYAYLNANFVGDDLWLGEKLLSYSRETLWDAGHFSTSEAVGILSNWHRHRSIRRSPNFRAIIEAIVDVTPYPSGVLHTAIYDLAASTITVDRNTVLKLMDGTVVPYYIDDLAQPANTAAVVASYGLDASVYTIYLEPPANTEQMLIQKIADSFTNTDSTKIFGTRTADRSRWTTILVHETNHAVNGDASNADNSFERYKGEFRAYWISNFRVVTDLDARADGIKKHVLASYPALAGRYNTDTAFKAEVDGHTRPDGNMDNG